MYNSLSYTPQHIVNYFLSQNDHKIDNLKLNKLTYIALGFSLAINNSNLFEERVEAWKYGPVIPSIYHEFKRFRNKVITDNAISVEENFETNCPEVPKSDTSTIEVLELVYQIYKDITSVDLVQATHLKNTPWSNCYRVGECNIIPRDMIKLYYDILIEGL